MSKEMLSFKGSVYPWHCDHMGHMNVMWYIGRFDEATWGVFAEHGLSLASFEAHGIGMAALEQTIKYNRELHAGDQIEVFSRLLKVSEKVIEFEHRMINVATDDVCATVITTAICLNTAERKGYPFPKDIYERLIAGLEGAKPE